MSAQSCFRSRPKLCARFHANLYASLCTKPHTKFCVKPHTSQNLDSRLRQARTLARLAGSGAFCTFSRASFYVFSRTLPRAFSRAFSALLLGLWKGYKLFISPLFGDSCRFYPSCSHYAYLLLANENPLRAIWKIAYRLLRCQPFAQGGVDYPIITLPITCAITPSITPFVPHHALRAENLAHIHIAHWLVPLRPLPLRLATAYHPCLAGVSPSARPAMACPCFLIPTLRSINEKR